MFGIVLTAAFTLVLAYVLWRCASVPILERRLTPWRLVAIGAGVWIVFVLGRVIGHRGTSWAAGVLEFAGMTLLGWILLTSIALLFVDLVTLFGLVLRRWAPRMRGLALAAGAVLAIIALIQGSRAPVVSSLEVELPGLPAAMDGTVLVAVSDAHLGALRSVAWFDARVAQIRALEPDLVVFLGDMFEGHGDGPQRIPSLERLATPLGKWYVEGNHECHRGAGSNASVALDRAGFHRLAGHWVELAPGLILAGVSDLTHHRRRGLSGDPVGLALADRPAGATVFLSHTPWQVERAAAEGAGLMLSGHTHGGQIWPWGYLVRTVYPYVAGRYEVDGMTLIVSRGVGTWGPRMRLWERGEILKITLRTP